MLAYKLTAMLHGPIAAVDPQQAEHMAQVLQQAVNQDKTAIMVVSYGMLGVLVALVAIAAWAVHVHARLAVGAEKFAALSSIEVSLDRNLSICESVLRLQTYLLTHCSRCNPDVADEIIRENSQPPQRHARLTHQKPQHTEGA